MADASSTPGLVESVRTLGGNLVASVRDRTALLSLELHEEKLRLVQSFAWLAVVVFVAVMAATFATLTVLYLFWDAARLAVLVGCTLFYTGATIGTLVAFRRFLARQPRPLEATLEELRADETCLRTEN